MAWASEKLAATQLRCSAVQPRIGSGTTIFEIFDGMRWRWGFRVRKKMEKAGQRTAYQRPHDAFLLHDS